MPNTPKIIGICGYPCHGKSTAQRFLELLGVEARDDAQVLRERVMAEYGLTLEDVTTQEGKKKIVPGLNGEMMTVRKLLGDYGQIHGEIPYGPNYWVEMAIQKLRDERVEHPVSFGSLRRSQAAAVRAVGGYVVSVIDPRKPSAVHDFDEYDFEQIDCAIINDGNLSDLAWLTFRATHEYLEPTPDQIVNLAENF